MKILVDYSCSECHASGIKLWRQYQTFVERIELLCLSCAEKDQGKEINLGRLPKDENDKTWERPTDSVEWLVPAVPVDGEETYWGYTSVPNPALIWWHLLPTFKDDAKRELAWWKAWGHAWFRDHLYEQARELERLGIKTS